MQYALYVHHAHLKIRKGFGEMGTSENSGWHVCFGGVRMHICVKVAVCGGGLCVAHVHICL